MNLRLARSSSSPASSPPADPALDATPSTQAAADAWLDVFTTLLRLPARQAAEVRDELGDHLKNRVRDLVILGSPEPDAVRRAVAELGDAADLAARYRHARTDPTRRTIMYGSLLGLSGAALIVGSAALFTTRRPEPPPQNTAADHALVLDLLASRAANPEPLLISQLLARAGDAAAQENNPALLSLLRARAAEALAQQPPAGDDIPGAEILWPEPPGGHDAETMGDIRMDVDFSEVTLGDAFDFLEHVLHDRPVNPDWTRFGQLGLHRDAAVTFRGKKMSLPEFFTALNQSLALAPDHSIDFRFSNRVMEIADRETFDRREITLAAYDLAPAMTARGATDPEDRQRVVAEVTEAIRTFVEPASWTDNGGDLACLKVVGDRLFVEAPRRFQRRIAWIIGRLPSDMPHAAAPAQPAPRASSAVERIETIPLKHVAASELVAALSPAGADSHATLHSDTATNCVLVCGPAADVETLAARVREADAEPAHPAR